MEIRIVSYSGGGAGNEGRDILVIFQVEQNQTIELVMDHVLLNQLIHELPQLAGDAYRQRKKADPNYDKPGTIQEAFIRPVKGHSIRRQTSIGGAVLTLIHEDGVTTDYHMADEALQLLAHDILDAAQSKRPPD